jgi:phage gp36-like protein
MGYATQDDIDQLYGADLLVRIADYDRDKVADPEVVQRGLDAANEICDAYLSSQYTVPVVSNAGHHQELRHRHRGLQDRTRPDRPYR